jgi:hypothetical protein
VLVEWTRDSAYRFFPLVEHPDFGLVLHRSIWPRTRCSRSSGGSRPGTGSTSCT